MIGLVMNVEKHSLQLILKKDLKKYSVKNVTENLFIKYFLILFYVSLLTDRSRNYGRKSRPQYRLKRRINRCLEPHA